MQLKMFEDMQFKVDRASPIYKRFRLKVLGGFFFQSVVLLAQYHYFHLRAEILFLLLKKCFGCKFLI